MSEFKFDGATFEMVQKLAYPLVKALTGFDPQEFVGEKSELFVKIGDVFNDIGTLFLVAGTALEDGVLTAEEIEQIIASASTVSEAIEGIVSAFEGEEEEPENPS